MAKLEKLLATLACQLLEIFLAEILIDGEVNTARRWRAVRVWFDPEPAVQSVLCSINAYAPKKIIVFRSPRLILPYRAAPAANANSWKQAMAAMAFREAVNARAMMPTAIDTERRAPHDSAIAAAKSAGDKLL